VKLRRTGFCRVVLAVVAVDDADEPPEPPPPPAPEPEDEDDVDELEEEVDEVDELDEADEPDDFEELDDPLVVDPDLEDDDEDAPAFFFVVLLLVVAVLSVPDPLVPPAPWPEDPLAPLVPCPEDPLAPPFPVAPWLPPTRPIKASTSHRTVVLLALSIEPVSTTKRFTSPRSTSTNSSGDLVPAFRIGGR
jgi:hypothetical protein